MAVGTANVVAWAAITGNVEACNLTTIQFQCDPSHRLPNMIHRLPESAAGARTRRPWRGACIANLIQSTVS